MIQPDDVVLFQGDSITSAGRDRDDAKPNSAAALGHGYAFLAAARLLCDHAGGAMKIYNRGIGGDRVNELLARWRTDTLDLRPDVLSIHIGINDAAGMACGEPQRVQSVDEFEQMYRALIEQTIADLPNVKLVICEPFLTHEPAELGYDLLGELVPRQSLTRQIAADVGACFVPFQEAFDRAGATADGATWAADGVHPTPGGHYLMADCWIKAVRG